MFPKDNFDFSICNIALVSIFGGLSVMGFVYWKLTRKKINACLSHILVYSGATLLYAQDKKFGSAKPITFTFSKTKAVKVSDLTVNKCPQKREKRSRSNRAKLFPAKLSIFLSLLCVQRLLNSWRTGDLLHY